MQNDLNTSDVTWADLLSWARDAARERKFAYAIYLCELCIERFPLDADAKGWAFYNLFCLLLEYRNANSAAALALEIMELNSNLASKLYVVSVCLDYYIRENNKTQATKLVEAAGSAISKWKSGPATSDDFPIVLASEVVAQCSVLGLDHPEFRLLELNTEGKPIACLPSQEYPRVAPFFFNKLPSNVARYMNLERGEGKLEVREMRGVSLLRCGSYIVAFDQSDNIFKLSYDVMPEMFMKAVRKAKADAASEVRITGTTLSILDEFNHGINFCHWMVDYIPRVLFAVDSGLQFETIVGPSALQHDFQIRSLRDPLKSREYLTIDPGKVYKFDRLIYATNFASNLHHPLFGGHPVLLETMRSLFPSTTIGSKVSPLYVPRKTSRRVLNDGDLWKLLESRGFRRIDTDNMLLEEQIEAFRCASHVVAPHGAALTSLMFCNPGTEVLELFPKFGGSAAFYVISAAANLRYSCYTDISSDEQNFIDTGKTFVNESPLMADIEFVSSWLDKVGLS